MLNLPVIQANPMAHFADMSREHIAERIESIREIMGDDLLILGHHYQSNAIVQHADMTGDSFLLAQLARSSNATHVVFCGVHFMPRVQISSPQMSKVYFCLTCELGARWQIWQL